MSKLIWKPVFQAADIASLGRNSHFYLLQGEDFSFLFIHEANEVSVLIISFEETGLTVYHVLEIQSDNFISKINGDKDFILMLDTNDDLFYLKGIMENDEITFNLTNVLSFLSNDVTLKWSKLGKLKNCLAMEGTSQGASFISHDDHFVYIKEFTTINISREISKLTPKKLNYFDGNKNYLMVKITGENAEFINNKILRDRFATNEVLLIIEPHQLRFSKPQCKDHSCSKSFPLDFQAKSIISIINFNKKGFIFVICKSGQIICMKLKTGLRNIEFNHLFIEKKVYAVTGYEDVEIKLFWSDLNYLYMSTVSDNLESTKLQMIYKIGGVLRLVTSNDNFLMLITRNGCIYEARRSLVEPKTRMTSKRGELLTRIHKSAKLLGELIEKIKVQEYFIEALEISKIASTSNNMQFIVSNDSITLQNNTNCVFLKKFWRVQIEVDDFHNKELEIRDLNIDVVPNGSVNFEWNSKNLSTLRLTLFCDIFLPNDVIFIEVKNHKNGDITCDEDNDLNSYVQYLSDTYNFEA